MSFPLTATGGTLVLSTLLCRRGWIRALFLGLSASGPHRLVVRVVGRPRPQALIGVEVHGVDFLPANFLQSHSCLIWGQQGFGEGCAPIDRKAWTSNLDPPARKRSIKKFVFQCTSIESKTCVNQKQLHRVRDQDPILQAGHICVCTLHVDT